MTVYAITDTKKGRQGLRLLIFKLPDVTITSQSQVRVLQRLCWKCNCCCFLSRLRNKSSIFYNISPFLNAKNYLALLFFVDTLYVSHTSNRKKYANVSGLRGWNSLHAFPKYHARWRVFAACLTKLLRTDITASLHWVCYRCRQRVRCGVVNYLCNVSAVCSYMRLDGYDSVA